MKENTIENRMKELACEHRELAKSINHQIWDKLVNIIDLYLSCCQSSAFEMFYELFIHNIDNMRTNTIRKDSCLYRMRVGKDEYEEFSSNEMFHIPFQLNHLVKNERFSISGFPSLYLGSSVYVCWEEMRRPDLDNTNIALFKTTEDVFVLDLSNKKNYNFTNEKFSDCLTIACTLPVLHPNAPFKPEYIISQLLLQSLVRYNKEGSHCKRIIGIKYSSTHIKDNKLWINYPENMKNSELFYNYVFPVFDRVESGISEQLTSLFQFWHCITYNKMKLMYPDFQSDKKNIYNNTAFGKIEEKLKNTPSPDMLYYDSSNPKGALTL